MIPLSHIFSSRKQYQYSNDKLYFLSCYRILFVLLSFNYIFVFLSYILILGMFFPKSCSMFNVAIIPLLVPCTSFTIKYNWCAWNIRLFLSTLYFLLPISHSSPQHLESSNLSFNHNLISNCNFKLFLASLCTSGLDFQNSVIHAPFNVHMSFSLGNELVNA